MNFKQTITYDLALCSHIEDEGYDTCSLLEIFYDCNMPNLNAYYKFSFNSQNMASTGF